MLPESAGDAVGWPVTELGVVFGVSVGGGYDRDAVRGGVTIEPGDVGNDPLGAGDIECARRVEKVELRIDVEEDGGQWITFIIRDGTGRKPGPR